MRVLEIKDLGAAGGGVRVRVALAAEQTAQLEKVLHLESYVFTPAPSASSTRGVVGASQVLSQPGPVGITPRNVSMTPRGLVGRGLIGMSAGRGASKSAKGAKRAGGAADTQAWHGWVDAFGADSCCNLRPYVRPRDLSRGRRSAGSSRSPSPEL